MAVLIPDATTRANCAAATSQQAQCEALIAAWDGGNVTARLFAADGSTLLRTLTLGPFTVNSSTPRGVVCAAHLADTHVATGTPGLWVFRSGSTDIFSIDAGTSGASVNHAGAVKMLCTPTLQGVVVTAQAGLPPNPPPPYTLPMAAGEVVKIGINRAVDVAPPDWGAFFTDFCLRVSFGAGVMQPEYSARGAYVYAGIGGHAHPDLAGAIVFDYTDATWKRFEHQNGGTQYATLDGTRGFKVSQMNGVPHYELTDTITTEGGITYAVPGPVHPYQMLTVWPSAYGGGEKGGVAYVTRSTMGEGGQTHSPSTHGLNLTTMKWERFPNLATRDPISSGRYEGAVVWDEARARWWLWHEDMFNYQSLTFLNASDRTWGQTANWTGFLNDELGAAGRMFLHQGLLFVQGTNGSLWGFDPDNATAGWTRCTVTGGPLPTASNGRQFNLFVYYPPSGKFYSHTSFTYNATLHRLTPPASNPLTNAWTFDNITLDTLLPDTQPGGDVNHCTLLHYVPAIECLSWPGKVDETGGNVYLIKPE